MKKSIYIFAAMALFGCNMAEYAPVEPATNSIKASIEVEDTKTSVTDAGYFTWSEGDKIWLDTTNGGIEGVLAEGAGSSNATFTYGSVFGEITFKAVYPYGNHSISENTLTVNLPASYDLGDNTDNTNAAMYAILVDGNLKFTHLAGVMRFEFRNAPVGTNQFKITVDKKINGDFTADLTKDYPTLTTVEATSEEEKTITINFTPLKEKKNLRIYIPLPTGTYDSLSLELNAGENAVYTYSKAISNTINRKSLKLMPVITPGGSIGGDIENDDSIEGDIENNELFINCEANNAAFSSEGGENNEIYLMSNAETLISEPLTESPWISIELFKSNTENKWIIEATAEKNNTSDKRVAEFKVYPQGKPDTYVVLQYEQVGQGIYMNFVRRDEYGIADGAEIKNVTATSCDYTVKALADNPNYEGSGYIYNALVFETNLTDYTYVVPEEDQSWLIVGYDMSQNTILIQTNPNEEGAERRSKIEITDRQKNTVYYTINVIQAPEPTPDVYINTGSTNADFASAEFTSDGGENNELSIWSNAQELVSEVLTSESSWISIELCKANTAEKWVVVANAAENNTTVKREAQFKVYPQGKPETYVVLSYKQEGKNVYVTPSSSAVVEFDSWEACRHNGFTIDSNAEELGFEIMTDSPWISIELAKTIENDNRWVIIANATQNNTFKTREATIKIYAKEAPNCYGIVHYRQQPGLYIYYSHKDEYGIASGAEIKNITDTSCDYTVKALADNPNYEGSGYIYNALVFETNLTDYTYVVPEEDQSWLIVGYDLSQNTILIQTNPNEEGSERRSKIEITDRQKNTVYYTINVIQKAEPKEGDYIDEYGINHGQGIAINNVVWAPVNCGYHATDYKNGKFYQWGRKYGHGATPNIVDDLTSMEEGQLGSNSGRFYTNWPNKVEKDLWNSGTEEKPVKTDYDPCPTGWRVPTESELIALIKTKVVKDEALPGIWFNKENTPKIFFPASGWITSSGTLGSENVAGGFWSSNAYVGCFFNANAQVANRSAHYDDARSYSVRCVKEAK